MAHAQVREVRLRLWNQFGKPLLNPVLLVFAGARRVPHQLELLSHCVKRRMYDSHVWTPRWITQEYAELIPQITRISFIPKGKTLASYFKQWLPADCPIAVEDLDSMGVAGDWCEDNGHAHCWLLWAIAGSNMEVPA